MMAPTAGLCLPCETSRSDDEKIIPTVLKNKVEGEEDLEDSFWKTVLISSLYQAWVDDFLTDIVIVTQDEIFNAHKVVLAVASPYFRALLSSDLEEKRTNTLKLENISGVTFRILLKYMYCGAASLSEENVLEILSLSDYFQIHDLKRLCCSFMKQHLASSSYLPVYEIALLHGCMELANFCFQCSLKHCSKVLSESSFLQLNVDTVLALFQEPILDVASEDEIFQAGRNWLSFKEGRSMWTNQIFSVINSTLLSPGIRGIYEKELGNRSYGTMEVVFSRHRKGEELLMVFGGESNGRILGGAECFVMGCSSWRCSIPSNIEVERNLNHSEGRDVIPPISNPRVYAAIATDGNMVCLIGGLSTNRVLRSVEKYNIVHNRWNSLPELPIGVHGSGAAFHQKMLWVIGGQNTAGNSNATIMFNEDKQVWTLKSQMKIGRVHAGVGAILGCIFVVGGWGVETGSNSLLGALSSCEKYCIETDSWIRIASLGHGRAYHGVAVINDILYAIGGYDGQHWLDSVERYDPLKDRWERVSPMIGPRSSFGVTVSNCRIYCMGGFSGSTVLNTVEKYNPTTDMWHCVPSMQLRRYGHTAATLRLPTHKLDTRRIDAL